MKKRNQKLRLLPFYFRNIGLGIILLILLSKLLEKSGFYQLEFLSQNKSIIEVLLILAFLIIALTKNRVENERTLEVRMKIYTASLIAGIIHFIIHKILNAIEFFGTTTELSAFQLLITIFSFYFIFTIITKRYSK